MVNMFKLYDANGSGDIDKHEARKILEALGMDASLEKAEELLNIIDENGTGEINFEEFCRFICMIKDGDDRLAGYGGLLGKLNDTPLGTLEHQTKQRHLALKFLLIEEREATASQPVVFVVEVGNLLAITLTLRQSFSLTYNS